MRIGIDARFFGGEQSKGLGRYTQKLIEHIVQHDHSNHYVLFLQDDTAVPWKQLPDNVEIQRAPFRWYTLAEQIFFPITIARAKVDCMHFPHFNVPLLYSGPFIVTIHDLIISRFPTERATTLGPMTYRIKQLAYHRVIAHAARQAKKIITVSHYSKKDIIDYFHLPADRVQVIYEAVDDFASAATTVTDQQAIIKRYGITRPYVLYIGNAYPHKNLEILLAMISQLKKAGPLPFKLVLVGKADYFYLRLQQAAWAKDVEHDVIFPGFVPDADLPALYQQALAYIFPSKYEGFGLPPLEAMYYGTPVLSSTTSCLPEILGEAALYFDFQDVNGIIKQIMRLLQDDNLRQQLISLGHAQVQRYSWAKAAAETVQLYESVFSQSQAKTTPHTT